METKILKVVRQGEAFSVQSLKQESGSIQKCNIVLRELGGSKFENEYVCTMLGNLAACKFYEGDVVAATLRFSTHEYQGQVFQEILATDIVFERSREISSNLRRSLHALRLVEMTRKI